MKNAIIGNLIIANPSVVGGDNVGTIAGYVYSSEIVNCVIAGGSISGDGNNVGGIAGSSLFSTITSCYTTASISGSSNVGGVVGSFSCASIASCYSTGFISGNSSVGNVCGSSNNESYIVSCYYIDQLDDSTNVGIGSNQGSGDAYAISVANINSDSIIDEMNSAISDAGYSDVKYSAGTDYYLPSLMSESVKYTGDIYELPDITIVDGQTCIYTATELSYIGFYGNYPTTGSYKLMNDITISGQWTPIGTSSSNCFKGTFDGNNHTIYGLSINNNNDYQGLFGYVLSATISNLTVSSPSVSGGGYVGAIVGYGYVSTIKNCAVVDGSVNGGKYIGGVIGYSYASVSIISCYNTSSVSGTGSYVGGIEGYCKSSSSIKSCYNVGEVSGDSSVGGIIGLTNASPVISCYNVGLVSGQSDVGGVIGYLWNSSETSCYYIDRLDDGATAGIGSTYNSSGYYIYAISLSSLNSSSIIEEMNSAISSEGYIDVKYTAGTNDCLPSLMDENIMYEWASTTSHAPMVIDNKICIYTAEELSYIGIYDTYPLNVDYKLMNDITISGEWTPIGTSSSSYFSGTFDGDGHIIYGLNIYNDNDHQGLFGYIRSATISNLTISSYSVKGGSYVGAIAGYNYGSTIENSATIDGYVYGNSYVGGIVGYSYSSAIISACYNTGSVNGEGNRIGGIAGCSYYYNFFNPISITNTYRYPTIISCYNTGSINGGSNVGGIVGYSLYSLMTSCYNASPITGDENIGGVLGYSSADEITSCYYIDQYDDATSGIGYLNYGSGEISTITITTLNSSNIISEMNTATSNAGYSSVKYTAGTGSYLPSLMGESILYE